MCWSQIKNSVYHEETDKMKLEKLQIYEASGHEWAEKKHTSKLTLAYWLMLAEMFGRLKKNKSEPRQQIVSSTHRRQRVRKEDLSPKLVSFWDTAWTAMCVFSSWDKSREISARSTAFTRETDKQPLPPKEPTLLNPWQPTNGRAPRTTVHQSQQTLWHMLPNQILQHKARPENRGWTPLAKNE